MTYSDILNTVIENGRIDSHDGEFDRESLIVEIEFEAQEQGLSEAETAKAVAFALTHTNHD